MENEIVITEMQMPVDYVENSTAENDYLTAYMDTLLEICLIEQEQSHQIKKRRMLLKKIKVEEHKAYNKQVNLFIAS